MSKRKITEKSIPSFRDEDEERAWWAEHDAAGHMDWSRARKVRFPDLKPSTTTISLRLSERMLEELKQLANRRDVPYQSLLKIFLAERIEEERARYTARPPKSPTVSKK